MADGQIRHTDTLEKISKDMVVTSDQAALWEILRLRLDWLEPGDRLLIELHWNAEIPASRLAKLQNVNAAALRSRIHRIADRLVHSDYVLIRRYGRHFTQMEQHIAYDRFIQGLGYRRIALKRNITTFYARKVLRRLRAWCAKQRPGQQNNPND